MNVLWDALPDNLREVDCLVMEIEEEQVVSAVIDETEATTVR